LHKNIFILSGLLIACLISIFLLLFFQKQYISQITKNNDKLLADLSSDLSDRAKEIEDLKNNPIIKTVTKTITKEILKTIPDKEKDELIIKFQDENNNLRIRIDVLNKIIDSDTSTIETLKASLEKTNIILKNRFIPNWGFNFAIMGGVDQKLNIDCYGIITARKYFFDGHFYFGFGAGLKFYDKWGGAGILEIGFTF